MHLRQEHLVHLVQARCGQEPTRHQYPLPRHYHTTLLEQFVPVLDWMIGEQQRGSCHLTAHLVGGPHCHLLLQLFQSLRVGAPHATCCLSAAYSSRLAPLWKGRHWQCNPPAPAILPAHLHGIMHMQVPPRLEQKCILTIRCRPPLSDIAQTPSWHCAHTLHGIMLAPSHNHARTHTHTHTSTVLCLHCTFTTTTPLHHHNCVTVPSPLQACTLTTTTTITSAPSPPRARLPARLDPAQGTSGQ